MRHPAKATPFPLLLHGSRRRSLDLLGAPAGIGFAHVRGRLDGRNELEDDIGETDDADDGAGNDTEDAAAEDDGADEDVDW
jgi:hypothetical protein